MTDEVQAPVPCVGKPVSNDWWAGLRDATTARIGLGRIGDAQPIASVLAFQLDHARARDAIHTPLNVELLQQALGTSPSFTVSSRAANRGEYLRRPDLGRSLDEASWPENIALSDDGYDCAFVLGDGLSAIATQCHAVALLNACVSRLGDWRIAPVAIAQQARVALGDEIGDRLRARIVVILLGERPGLSTADSLGAYLTFAPRKGRRDSERNCVSNIHANGLSTEGAAEKICWLLREAVRLGLTGTELKDDASKLPLAEGREITN
ncbi:MAG TPA: ethanolamine ammonia-lyase subunit EutC [Sphingobium sp.]|nr:ethanolamine ammonia-lyase subunit EutC [Sphingobium sp.]